MCPIMAVRSLCSLTGRIVMTEMQTKLDSLISEAYMQTYHITAIKCDNLTIGEAYELFQGVQAVNRALQRLSKTAQRIDSNRGYSTNMDAYLVSK